MPSVRHSSATPNVGEQRRYESGCAVRCLARLAGTERPANRLGITRPAPVRALVGYVLRAIGIVHVEDRRLHDSRCRPSTPDVRDFPQSWWAGLRDFRPARRRPYPANGMVLAKNRGLPSTSWLRLTRVGNDGLQRLLHGRPTIRPAPSTRSSASGSRDARLPLRPAPKPGGEIQMQHLEEAVGLGQLFQAAPVLRTALGACQLVLDLRQLQLAGTYRFGLLVLFSILRLLTKARNFETLNSALPVTRVAAGNVFYRAHVVLGLERRPRLLIGIHTAVTSVTGCNALGC